MLNPDGGLSVGTTVYDAFPSLADVHNVNRDNYRDIREDVFWEVFELSKAYTCLSVERFYNIFQSIKHVAEAKIGGDFVECGVFLGGSMIGAARFADHFGLKDRRFFAFDTFSGFPTKTVEKDLNGGSVDLSALPILNNRFRHIVEHRIADSGIDPNRFVLVEGMVEDVLPTKDIGPIAYLRLDTDYYDSTMIELEVLYPKVTDGGVLIIDDYGHFDGVRAATDLYFGRLERRPFLHRVDYTGRCGTKPSAE
jgi:O-methyltransferase